MSPSGEVGNFRKGLILGGLVAQSATVSLLARRACQASDYSGAAASLLQELAKLPLAVLLLAASGRGGSIARVFSRAFLHPRDLLQLAVPSGCFAVQNVLFFVAHERLPATTYLVLSQSKTLFTAVFAASFLGVKLRPRQWFSQPLLMVGCALVLLQQMGRAGADAAVAIPLSALIVGANACLVSSAFSGFASVYFERVCKTDTSGFWPRQLQLALVTSLFTLPALPRGVGVGALLAPFTRDVWIVVALKAVGGLLIGATIKYISSISKNFASAIAIVVTAAASPGALLSPTFQAGIVSVFGSMALFGSKPRPRPPTEGETQATKVE